MCHLPRSSKVQEAKRASLLLAASILILVALGSASLAHAQLPLSTGAPYVGQKAPNFTLPDQNGKPVSLSDLLAPAAPGKKHGGVVLIFYRGYW